MSTVFPRAAALFALALTAFAASAADPPAPTDTQALPLYETLDANRDGIVTLPEIVVHAPSLAERIKHCDIDRDDKLTREEYAACKPKDARGGK